MRKCICSNPRKTWAIQATAGPGALYLPRPRRLRVLSEKNAAEKAMHFGFFQMYPKFECPAFNLNFLLGLQTKQSATTCHKKSAQNHALKLQ